MKNQEQAPGIPWQSDYKPKTEPRRKMIDGLPFWCAITALLMVAFVVMVLMSCTAVEEVEKLHLINLERHAKAAVILQERHGVELTAQQLEQVYIDAAFGMVLRPGQQEAMKELDAFVEEGIKLQAEKKKQEE